MRKRLDNLLFEKGLVGSRTKAQALIMAGLVSVDGRKETKPGSSFNEDTEIKITETSKYVGRGAEKLEGAHKAFKIDFKDKIVVDIGSSTGGFTDYALQHGAKKVYAIDVGTGQLDWRLRQDPRVVVMEKTDFRKIEELPEATDVFLIDVSFVSARRILEKLREIMGKLAGGAGLEIDIIALFKPQFEAGKKIADKFKGVIKDPEIHEELLKDFRFWCQENKFEILGEIESPLKGAEGNKEFLFYLRPSVSEKLKISKTC